MWELCEPWIKDDSFINSGPVILSPTVIFLLTLRATTLPVKLNHTLSNHLCSQTSNFVEEFIDDIPLSNSLLTEVDEIITNHTLSWAKSHQLHYYNFSICFDLQLHPYKTLLWASHLSSVACILNVLLPTNTHRPPSLPCKAVIRPAVILREKFYTVITSLSTIIFLLLTI